MGNNPEENMEIKNHKISRIVKARWESYTPEERAAVIARMHPPGRRYGPTVITDEYRRNMSEIVRKRWSNPEFKKKTSRAISLGKRGPVWEYYTELFLIWKDNPLSSHSFRKYAISLGYPEGSYLSIVSHFKKENGNP